MAPFKFNLKKKISKAGRKVTKASKVGLAAVRLGGKLTNPYNQAKMGVNAVRGKGLVLPGTRYIGPGNAINAGKPVNAADAAARRHDLAYDAYLKAGVKPSKLYLGYSDADKRLLRESDATTPDGLATYLGMAAKKGIYKLGLSGKMIKDKNTVEKRIKSTHRAARTAKIF